MAYLRFFAYLVCIMSVNIYSICGRIVSGHLKTLDDWAFVARFCFLSGKGRYEYHIEFERRFGEPKLLLYYDDKDQWPAVYKTGKTCLQKLMVLRVADNQIVTLSARNAFSMQSGCTLRTSRDFQSESPRIPISPYPTRMPEDQNEDINYTYFDQFLKSSTYSPDLEDIGMNYAPFNDTDVFNSSDHFFFPIGSDTGFENKIENNTNLEDYVENLFGEDQQGSNKTKVRIKRGILSRDSRGTLIVTCNSAGGFLTSRERWWYIAISNCGNKKGIDIRYKFRMTNGPPGDFWHEHFSADEMYIPPILLCESLLYTFLLLAVFICAVELKNRHLFHCTYRLFAASVFLQYIGIIFLGVAWSKYAVTGLGPHNILGLLLQGASEIIFLVMLLLMAKGYTITRARLSTCTTVKLTVFINIYIIVYFSLFIYREEFFDPGEVLNLYESPAGLGIAGLRSGSWGAFVVAIISTVRKFPEKVNFYFPFGILGSMWILGGPILTFTGIGLFDPWVRESVMYGVLGTLAFCGHSSFLWLTWPSRANTSFPYHVRTNHVGVMQSTEDDGADYPRHIYEPNQQETNIIIPLSRRTEDLLNNVYNQYLNERDYYHSTSTPHSHVSFPPGLTDVTRTPPVEQTRTDTRSITSNAKDNNDESGAAKNSGNQIEMNQQSPIEQDGQADSGHQSFDTQKGDSPNSPTPLTEINSPPTSSAVDPLGSIQNQNGLLKNNPFIKTGLPVAAPNKIILEPIKQNSLQLQSRSSVDVPKHLFAARKPTL